MLNPKLIADLQAQIDRLFSETRSLSLWREWLQQYHPPQRPSFGLRSAPEIEEVYEQYRTEDPRYHETRTYIGHLAEQQDWDRLLGALVPFREFLGPAAELPMFLVYPSCVDERDLVSLLFPLRGVTDRHYLGHVSVDVNLLQAAGIHCFEDLEQFLQSHRFGPFVPLYFHNKRACVFPRKRGR